MRFGCWIHNDGAIALADQIVMASKYGVQSIRSYDYQYASEAAPILQRSAMSLFAGLHVSGIGLLHDWRSQLNFGDLAAYHDLGVPLEAICVGNELREGGDTPADKTFTAGLSSNLAHVIGTYRQWLRERKLLTPLTYAMEFTVFDDRGVFYDWMWQLIDACDIVSINAYPMDIRAWFTFGAFEESRRFLRDSRVRRRRLEIFEFQLRQILDQLRTQNKPVILSEAGFPSAVGYILDGERLVAPECDNELYSIAMLEFLDTIRHVNIEYKGQICAIYLYEWRDNLHHPKIWNVEQSPIHVAFGLCDRFGTPKFDLHSIKPALEP